MTQEQTPYQPQTFVEEGKALISDVIDATEEGREAQRIKNTMNLAGLLARVPALTGLKPSASKDEREQAKYEAFAKIEIGKEIGLQPAESLRAIYFDQNGAGIDIHTRVAMALATGRHRFEIRHLNATGCSIQWFQKREGQWHACEPTHVTRDQLKTTMVYENGKQKPITEKWNYKSWWEDMAYGFVQRRNIRRYAPETQGSFAIAPAEEAVMEDDGLREGQELTEVVIAKNIVDLTGSDGTSDTAAQDQAKADATDEAAERRECNKLLSDIQQLQSAYGIELGPFIAWVDKSETRQPCGLQDGLVKAPRFTLQAVYDHLCLHEADACTVLLGQQVPLLDDDDQAAAWAAADAEDADDAAWLAAQSLEQG